MEILKNLHENVDQLKANIKEHYYKAMTLIIHRVELELGHLVVEKEEYPRYKECVQKQTFVKSFSAKTEVCLSYFAFICKTLPLMIEKVENAHDRVMSKLE